MMIHWTRRFLAAAAPKATVMDKAKSEGKKLLKMQLALIPLCAIVLFWMYPPLSAEEEKKRRIEYERSAGWKS